MRLAGSCGPRSPNKLNAVVRTFDFGRSTLDSASGLAMAVFSGGSDILFISLFNSNSNVSYISSPKWVSCPFDSILGSPATINIVGTSFVEDSSNK